MTATATAPPDPDRLDRAALTLGAVLAGGGLLAVLDTTVTNVAIGPLSAAMDAPLPVIQWVSTGYTLALATVVPASAWLVSRLGAKRVYLGLLGLPILVGPVVWPTLGGWLLDTLFWRSCCRCTGRWCAARAPPRPGCSRCRRR